jgi:hypothetical protein
MNNEALALIFDNAGVIYIGDISETKQDSEYLLIRNPAQIFYNIKEDTKDVEINIIPVCFPEILSAESKEKGTRWVYQRKNARFISAFDVKIDERVVSYYRDVFTKMVS